MRTVLLISLALGGCWVPMTQGKVMEGDIRTLRDRVMELEDRAEDSESRLRGQLAKADEQSQRLAKTLDQVEVLARRAKAGFGEDLASIRRELATVVGRLEQLEQGSRQTDGTEVDQALKTQTEALALIVERVAALEAKLSKPVVVAKKKSPGEAARQPSPEREKKEAQQDSRTLFKRGRSLLSSGRHEEGRRALKSWLNRFGSSRDKGRRAAVDDVYVYLGESYLKQGRPKEAVPQFQRVYETMKQADMWSRAVFRLAECFEQMQDKAVAKAFYKIAVKNGKGRYKKDAERRLKRLQ
ncbi:MAG: hypothetical protein CMH55_09375 [Myxococcales bacterium]|nr:hypothetical protein [Myxococcales bacterium]